MRKKSQIDQHDWKSEWVGMPEYNQKKTEFHTVKVVLTTEDAMKEFSELIGQPVSLKSKIIYYPVKLVDTAKGKRYVDES